MTGHRQVQLGRSQAGTAGLVTGRYSWATGQSQAGKAGLVTGRYGWTGHRHVQLDGQVQLELSQAGTAGQVTNPALSIFPYRFDQIIP